MPTTPTALFVALLFLFSACQPSSVTQETVEDLSILPAVQNKQMRSKKGLLIQQKITLSYNHPDLEVPASLLQEYLEQMGVATILTEETTQQGIQLILEKGSLKNPEAYRLNITDGLATLSASDPAGIRHAIQSLRQMLLAQQAAPFQLPALEIEDAPRFAWRGLLLDCSRHFMDKDFVKRYIDLLALYKMNRLHWHITEDQGWRLEIKKYPELTAIGAWRDDGNGGKYGGFYTQEDVREILAYANKRGVMVIPEIELPGHAQAALAAYPQHSCTGGPFEVETEWGVFKEIYCAGDDSTFIFLEAILKEVIDLFPAPYIHIGGDEVPKYRWENCPKCQKRIQQEGLKDEHELQSYFIKRIERFLATNNRQLIGWDEILEGGLAEGAIVQSWRGFDGAKAAVQSGHQAIVSPTSHAYFDYGLNDIDLEKVYGFNPIPEGLSPSEAALILGGECNMWSERAPQHKVDAKVFPRILAMAEVLWSGPGRDFPSFKTTVQRQYPILDKLKVDYGLETVPVAVKTMVKDGDLWVSLISGDENQENYYQLNQQQALRYQEPFQVQDKTVLNIHFERNGKQFRDTVVQHLQAHLANGIVPQLDYEYHKNYTAGGPSGLTDGKTGSNNFKDGNWQGCWGDDMQLVIDLGSEKPINKLEAGFLQYNNAWIFFPTAVHFWASADGKTYQLLGKIENQSNPKVKEQFRQAFSLKGDGQAYRFIKMKASTLGICPEWHDAAGSKAWLFMDELIIE